MINKDMTIADALVAFPQIMKVLSDVGIDFCCGGDRKLEVAISDKNLDVDEFIEKLNAEANKKVERVNIEDAFDLSKEELIDYIIMTYHKKELDLLEKIDSYLQKLIMVHYKHHGDELADIYNVFLTLKAELLPHFAKEEAEVFPEFLKTGDVDFSELIEEHEAVGELLTQIEDKTNKFTAPEDGCNTYRYCFELMKDLQDDIHEHVFLENSILFKK